MGTINSPERAVKIALSQVGRGIYQLGTGDADDHPDDPTDCAGFAINRCYGIKRHRPGFNHGPWASVEDDLNCNSAIEDAEHKQELFTQVFTRGHDGEGPLRAVSQPHPGDLITYPTFYLPDHKDPWIGHIAIVTSVPAEWDWGLSPWRDLGIVQCCGPNGRRPGIIAGTAGHWDLHDSQWPKPEHRTRLIRVRQP